MRRFVCFFLSALIIMLNITPLYASANDDVMPIFENISTVYACLSIDERLGVTTCTGRIVAKDEYPVSVDVILQVKRNGDWDDVSSWTASGTWIAACQENYAVYSGYEYRVLTWGYVHDANGRIIESGSAVHEVNYPKQ